MLEEHCWASVGDHVTHLNVKGEQCLLYQRCLNKVRASCKSCKCLVIKMWTLSSLSRKSQHWVLLAGSWTFLSVIFMLYLTGGILKWLQQSKTAKITDSVFPFLLLYLLLLLIFPQLRHLSLQHSSLLTEHQKVSMRDCHVQCVMYGIFMD